MDSKLRLGEAAGRGTLAAAILASGMAFLDSTVVNVALPKLGGELNASLAELQWVVNGYTLTLAAFVLLGGALGDRFGRRKVFLIGVLWFTAASFVCGLAVNPEMLITARVLQGVGAALLTPGSLSLIQSSFHVDDRGRAIGAWSGLSGVTTALGPFLGGLLIDHASWRWIFFMNIPLAAMVYWLSLRFVPESSDPSAAGGRFDFGGALLGALALAGLTYALISPGTLGWIALGIAALAAVAFLLVERARGPRAMMPLNLFSSRVFSVLNIYTVIVYGAFGGLFFLLAIFLQTFLGYSALLAGMATLPVTVLLLVFSARSGALATRIGPRPQLVAGPILCGVGAFLLHFAGSNYWLTVFPGVLVFAIGLTLLVAPLTTTVLAAIEERFAGVASGVNNAAARAGSLLAVAALPLLVGLSGSEYAQPEPLAAAYRSATLWCAAFLTLGGLIALTLPRTTSARG